MDEKRICRKCLLQDLAEEQQLDLKKYLAVIKKQDKTEHVIYEERLNICRACDRLLEATCEACGCYVEFRAAVWIGKCPYKKWKR